MLLTGQGNPPSSLAAAWPLSSHATAQGGSREEQGTPAAALRGACVESDSCNRESLRALKSHAEGRQGVPAQTGAHHHGPLPATPRGCSTAQPCPGRAKRLRASRAASSHARGTAGEWTPPPVLGWTPGVTPGTHLCRTPGVQPTVGEDTQAATHWDRAWGKPVEKRRQFAHQCWLEVTTGSAPITGQHPDP